MTGETIIQCAGLGKRYGRAGSPALDNLDLEVPRNTVFGFLGPNGAGKTTTIRILAGLMSQSAGEAYVDGHRVGIHGRHREVIGVLRQHPAYYGWMTARELLEFVAALNGMSRVEGRHRADELLETVGLADHADKRIGEYSGGMVQRLGIAQALVNRPKVLLLDEPVSSLDPIGRRDVLEIIEQLGRETTIFMSTHILADVERVCDTVGVINEGRMVAVERVEDLREAHGSRRLELHFDGTAGARHFAKRATERGWRATTEEGGRTVWVSPGAGAGTGARAPDAGATDDFRREVLRLIVDEDIDLESLQTRASLEEAFVRLIGADASKALAGPEEASMRGAGGRAAGEREERA